MNALLLPFLDVSPCNAVVCWTGQTSTARPAYSCSVNTDQWPVAISNVTTAVLTLDSRRVSPPDDLLQRNRARDESCEEPRGRINRGNDQMYHQHPVPGALLTHSEKILPSSAIG